MSFEGDLLELVPRLRRFAASLSRDRADGDGLCQATLERALLSRAQWQPETRLDSWTYRIMRNLWIDQGWRPTGGVASGLAGESIGHAGGRRIEEAMALLPDEQREVVALILVEAWAYKDAAELLGISMGTLISRLVRGRGALIAMMEDPA